MTVAVVLILAVAWAAVLVPPVVRARARNRPGDSISEFHRKLNVLRRTGGFAPAPSPVTAPTPLVAPVLRSTRVARRAIRRRHDVFVTLLAGVVATGALGFIPVLRVLWVFHAVFDVLLVSYTGLLIRFRNARTERAEKVRYLPATAPVPELAYRHSASS